MPEVSNVVSECEPGARKLDWWLGFWGEGDTHSSLNQLMYTPNLLFVSLDR